ncbi:MAG TPA: HAMP domain-containing sensor histidine kinase [Longimicrobium sp.]|nr:HAMP domain-containing sensor histidine kinase [Longimicrobium sp.]
MRGYSLRAKVFALFAGATLLIVVPTLLLIAGAVERKVYADAARDLALADSALQNAWEVRGTALVSTAQARAFEPAVGDAWRGRRWRTLERRLQGDDDKAVVLAADTAFAVVRGARVDSAALARAAAGSGTAVVMTDGGPLRLAMAEVNREEAAPPAEGDSAPAARSVRLGMVGIGTRLSAAGLRKESASPADVLLLVGDSIAGTTLPDSVLEGAGEADLASIRQLAPGREQLLPLGNRTYFTRVSVLPARGPRVAVLFFRPVADELRISTGIQRSLFGIGFAALLLAVVLAAVVARIVARPTQALAVASARLARGDYQAPLPRDTGDEIGQLARAFGEMRRAIAEREERLRSAQAEMIHREKLAAMGRLVAQLSHEINNPIYNIQNCLEALERRGDPSDPNREFLTLAQEELARMATLTRQLLDQSRPLSDAAQPVDLNAVVQRVATLAGADLRERGIDARLELRQELPPVVAHPEGIQQVLANLVSNACDAMPDGGTLRLVTRADAEAVEVVVEDSGTGIAEAHLPHIFDAFYTTKPGVTGLGLGLFVSEGIIRGHRGRLSVESEPGAGSRFTIRLPRETLDESLAGAEPEPAGAHHPVAA